SPKNSCQPLWPRTRLHQLLSLRLPPLSQKLPWSRNCRPPLRRRSRRNPKSSQRLRPFPRHRPSREKQPAIQGFNGHTTSSTKFTLVLCVRLEATQAQNLYPVTTLVL